MSEITVTKGDLFESPAQTIVNATNAVGVMGGGIALAFRERYPEMYREYRKLCKEGYHSPLQPHFWQNPDGGKNVLNLVTKIEPRLPSTIENICMSLHASALHRSEWGLESLAIPALGCGLGGLQWPDVKPVIERHARLLHIPVEIYEPVA